MTIPNKKDLTIKELECTADDIVKRKNAGRYRRPIVIEFSGSPKAGKTSSINSLEVFLKRNGFTVKIIEERAAVCPVPNKQSPHFNYWTLMATLIEIIGVVSDNKCVDVLLIDRGIFDALCWFEWLVKTEKLDKSRRDDLEQFLLNREFVGWIDMVFAFTCAPSVSIEREYANLLTKKHGAIMNPKVLADYKNAVENTISLKGFLFNSIQLIDTTNLDQNEVGYQVTTNVLEGLKELIMEKIGYFKKEDLPEDLLAQRIFDCSELLKRSIPIYFDSRDIVEKNNNFIQPIPIAIIGNIDNSKLLVVKKSSGATEVGSPERDNYLIHVGGHIRYEDSHGMEASLIETIKTALRRELDEELRLTHSLPDSMIPFCVYDPQDKKSKQHLAICFQIYVDENNVKLSPNRDELVQNKGKSKSCRFFTFEELAKMKFDNWGSLILQEKFDREIGSFKELEFGQITLEETM